MIRENCNKYKKERKQRININSFEKLLRDVSWKQLLLNFENLRKNNFKILAKSLKIICEGTPASE